jgi:hypothetical protein
MKWEYRRFFEGKENNDYVYKIEAIYLNKHKYLSITTMPFIQSIPHNCFK